MYIDFDKKTVFIGNDADCLDADLSQYGIPLCDDSLVPIYLSYGPPP
jgi:hypothetical protein